jgi:hypothetical protein
MMLVLKKCYPFALLWLAFLICGNISYMIVGGYWIQPFIVPSSPPPSCHSTPTGRCKLLNVITNPPVKGDGDKKENNSTMLMYDKKKCSMEALVTRIS